MKIYTPEDYHALERTAESKSEYYGGEIFAMAGSTTQHAMIGTNLAGELHAMLKGKQYSPINSDQRIKVEATGLRTYPDVSVFCGPKEYDAEDAQRDTATNPTMLFEVLSEATEGYDRGTKAEHYRQIPSLLGYALLSQGKAHIELFERQQDGSWRLTEATGREASLPLPCIDVTLHLGDIYYDVEFEEKASLKVVTGAD